MSLSSSQKKYIKKHFKRETVLEIATKQNLAPNVVETFIKERYGINTNTAISLDSQHMPKISLSLRIKNWFRDNAIYILILSCLAFFSYINALGNGFVSDDRGLLINAPSWTTSYPFTQPFTFLRPLLYFITFKVAGFNPFLFRLPNILMHMGVAVLTYAILAKQANKTLAILAAALFAVHPILVESVSWISGGVYVQYSFFFLLSFFFYLLGRREMKFYIAALIAFVFSLMSSEKAIVLALLFPLYEFSLGNLKSNWKKIPVFFIAGAIWFFFNSLRLGLREQYIFIDQATEPSFINPLLQLPIAIISYLELLFWPNNLTLYHTEMIFTQMDYVIRLALMIIFIGILCFTFLRNKFLFFWLSFFLVALLPTLIFSLRGLAWIVAERYVYLGALGVIVAVAWGFYKLLEKKRLKPLVYIVVSIIVITLLIRTIARNIDWQDEDHLWLAAARTSPSSAQNHNNLGDYYGRHGDLENSVKEFKRAIEFKPNYADAYHNLGNAYREMGKIPEALQSYEKALSLNPMLWQSYQNIAAIYYMQGDTTKAKEYVQKGLTIDPENSNLKLVLGVIYLKTNETNRAREIFLAILAKDPTNQTAIEGLRQIESGTVVK